MPIKKYIKPIFLLAFLFSYPNYTFSQKWQQYSDSINNSIAKNNLIVASRFIKLAESDIDYSSVKRDTIFADFLYRKSLVNSFLGDYDTKAFEESLLIWKQNNPNYDKIMRIHYFLGTNYMLNGDLIKSYKNYEECYHLNKKNNIKKNIFFYNTIYYLTRLDFNFKNIQKSEKYAKEYIKYRKDYAAKELDFKYIEVLKYYLKDEKNLEIALVDFLDNYHSKNTNDQKLLYDLNIELFLINASRKDINNIIKIGEDLFKNEIKDKIDLNLVISNLIYAYIMKDDKKNENKYRILKSKYFPEDNQKSYYAELNELILSNDFEKFKIKFDEYETLLKQEKNYFDLLLIYGLSLDLYEKNILFKKSDIENQLNFLVSVKSSLAKEDLILLDIGLVQFYTNTNQISKALAICNRHLNEDKIENKLKFLTGKSTCEFLLGDASNVFKTTNKIVEIAQDFYGEYDPRTLPYLTLSLSQSLSNIDENTTRITSKILHILYANKLENDKLMSSVWLSLGTNAIIINDLIAAKKYFEKCLSIEENAGDSKNPITYNTSLLSLSNIYVRQRNFEKSKTFLDKVKVNLEANININKIAFGDYYYVLGEYYFYKDKFLDAKNNYIKSFEIYGDNFSETRKLNFILCDYFIKNDLDSTISSLEKINKQNKVNQGVSKIIYLLKYNAGDLKGAQNLLLDNLNHIIIDNNTYFQLLSDSEKETLYKGFSDQFEFLNTYLLANDESFLKEYINLRFYSKSLLFSNSFKIDDNNETNKELFLELKSNTLQINKELENKESDNKIIEDLKSKNRELEKILSVNTKPIAIPTLKDLNSKLIPGEAYVEIVRINKQSRNATKRGLDIINQFTDSISYGAIIVKKNTAPKFILIDDSNQLEKQYADRFKSKIINKEDDTDSYDLLFEKIDNELKDIKKIYLVTDGIYNSINIESIYNPNRKEYLIDYLKIQSIQNVRSITEEKIDFKVGLNTKTVLFGNPDFDLLIADANTNEFSLDRGLDNIVLDKIKSSIKIGRLEGTQKEIETLDAILKDSKITVELFSKTSATEDNLKNIQSPDILHIATHGYFLKNDDASKTKQSIADLINNNYKNDSYLKSGLLFAGAQNSLNGKQPENSNNGILTAQEAKSLNLKDTELVVLSACETGLGDNLVGEGVIGLQRAFMIVGAKSVIMSLWSVSDEKTQELMTLFYTNWIKNNMTKEEALYQAKIEMKKLYPQPYYWAGFVLLN